MQTVDARGGLAQLRAKTDRELVILLKTELGRSLALARQGNFQEAERGYVTAKTLLALAGVSGQERARLEGKLDDLRSALDQGALAAAGQASYSR